MNIFRKFFFITLFILINPSLCFANFGLAGGYGLYKNLTGYRVSLQHTSCLYIPPCVFWPITGYWEASINQANAKKWVHRKNHKQLASFNKHVYGGSVNHTFRMEKLYHKFPILLDPYVDAGLGLGYFNKKYLGVKRLGRRMLFEVKFGFGVRFGECREFDIGYKYIHFSNANSVRYNDAIDLNFLMLNYWFN